MKHIFYQALLAVFLIVTLTSTALAADKKDLQGWWVIDAPFVKQLFSEIARDAEAKDQKMIKMFLPRLEKMMKKRTMIITDDTIIHVYAGKEKKIPYKLNKIAGSTYYVEMRGREHLLVLKNGRLYNKREEDGKRPPMYMRKLTPQEIEQRKKEIAAANQPPAATAKADKRLYFLVHRATPQQIKQLLATQKDLLTITNSFRKETALFMAVSAGKFELVKELLTAGAKVDVINSRGNTPLFNCVNTRKPSKAIFDLLVKHGANIKHLNKNGETLLIVACDECQDKDFLNYLLTLGLDINHVSKWKATALSEAMQNDWTAGVQILLKNGADLSQVKSSISRLVREGNLAMLKLLAQNGITKDLNGETPIMHAISRSNKKVKAVTPAIIELFKSSINAKDGEGKTALFYCKTPAMAKQLIAAGADIKAKGKYGDSVVHAAVNAPTELLKFYIEEKGLDVNSVNKDKQTPLHYAVNYPKNIANITYLIEQKADVNKLSSQGYSPLAPALAENKPERIDYIKLLLANGAEPNRCSLELSKKCIFSNNQEALKLLVQKGLSLATNPKEHYTPFWYAIYSNKPEMIKLLIELGADPKVKNAAGKTALDLAKEFKRPNCIKILSQ